jgi:glycolate oxidase FAD binding subunit
MGLGFPPAAADVVVRTTSLDRVIEYEPADLTLTIQAGTTLGAVQELLRPEGQFLALDPPRARESTLGGIIATNASGPLRAAFGTARDLVIGTRVVNPDGVVTRSGGRVVKNVAGYDLNKLYIGSLGTVGVVVELSFKLWPLPSSESTLLGTFSTDALSRALAALTRTSLSPLSVEILSASAASECVRIDPGARQWLVATRLGGSERALARQLDDVESLFAAAGATDLQRKMGMEEGLWRQIADHAVATPGQVLLRVAVPLSHTADALSRLQQLADERGLTAGLQGRAVSGVAYAKLSSDSGWDDESLSSAAELVQRARGWATERGGSAVVEAAPRALKDQVDVWGDVGPSLRVMRALKEQLDPRGTLNRGRFVARI